MSRKALAVNCRPVREKCNVQSGKGKVEKRRVVEARCLALQRISLVLPGIVAAKLS